MHGQDLNIYLFLMLNIKIKVNGQSTFFLLSFLVSILSFVKKINNKKVISLLNLYIYISILKSNVESK